MSPPPKKNSHMLLCAGAPEPRGCLELVELDCGGDGKMCVPLAKTCDGRNDCGNWADEPSSCRLNECKTNNGGCHQVYKRN